MLTTLGKVKEFLRLDIIDDDVLITDLIGRVDSQIKERAKKTLEATDFTERYDGDGTNELMVAKFPINSVAFLKIDNIVIDSGDYYVYKEAGVVKLDRGSFTEGNQNIEISYNAGYVTAPAELEKAAICLVAADYLSSQSSIHTTEAEDIVDRREGLREQAEKILERY